MRLTDGSNQGREKVRHTQFKLRKKVHEESSNTM